MAAQHEKASTRHCFGDLLYTFIYRRADLLEVDYRYVNIHRKDFLTN